MKQRLAAFVASVCALMSCDLAQAHRGHQTAVVVSGISATPSSTSATINWTNSPAAKGQVCHGTTTSYGTCTTRDSSNVTSDSASLSGLKASTLYHYQISATATGYSQGTSPDETFTTTASSTPSSGIPAILAKLNPGVTYVQNNSVSDTFTSDSSLNSSLWAEDNCCEIGVSWPYNLNNVTFSSANGINLAANSSGVGGIWTPNYSLPQNGSYVQITAKLSPAWPAFWLNLYSTPTNEVDVFEDYGNNDYEITIHDWPSCPGNVDGSCVVGNTTISLGFDPTAAFHVYGFYFGSTSLAFVVDGSVVWTWATSNDPDWVDEALPIILDNGYCTGQSWCGTEGTSPNYYIKSMQVFNPK